MNGKSTFHKVIYKIYRMLKIIPMSFTLQKNKIIYLYQFIDGPIEKQEISKNQKCKVH